jgi:hypothetical protein
VRRLVPHLARHGADGEARAAAANVMRYFDTSALHYHADEEQDLFPRSSRRWPARIRCACLTSTPAK